MSVLTKPQSEREQWDALTPEQQWALFCSMSHSDEQLREILKLIPPCPLHGDQCIPHAKDYLQTLKKPITAVSRIEPFPLAQVEHSAPYTAIVAVVSVLIFIAIFCIVRSIFP